MSRETNQKQNVFDHILYEFEMYIETHEMLENGFFQRRMNYTTVLKNAVIESHAIHLRNLLSFFEGKDSINCNTICTSMDKIGIKAVEQKKKIISLAVCHLGEERYICSSEDSNISIQFAKLSEELFPVVCKYIFSFLNKLQNGDVHNKYLDMYENDKIQKRQEKLYKLLTPPPPQ